VDMGASGLGRCAAGAHATTSADVHAAWFRENHMLSPVIKCAKKIFLHVHMTPLRRDYLFLN
jgi:hypothetical protein